MGEEYASNDCGAQLAGHTFGLGLLRSLRRSASSMSGRVPEKTTPPQQGPITDLRVSAERAVANLRSSPTAKEWETSKKEVNGSPMRASGDLVGTKKLSPNASPRIPLANGAAVPEGKRGLKDNWLPDESVKNCLNCNEPFTLVRRRHHCRFCGGIFCDQCSTYRVKIPELKVDKPQRVCLQCFWKVIEENDADGAPGSRHSSSLGDMKDTIVYNGTRLITTKANSNPSSTFLFPYLNKSFYAIQSRVQSGDAFCVRDTAKLCMDHCSGHAPNSFSVVPSDVPSGTMRISPFCGLRVEVDFIQYDIKDCYFTGLTAMHMNHSFLHSTIWGGGLEAKPGCGLYIGPGVSYELDAKQLKIVAEEMVGESSKLPPHITRGCGMFLGGPAKVRLTGCQIKAGIGIWVKGDCDVIIEGGSIVGKEAAILCEGPNSSVRVSKTTLIQGECKSVSGTVHIEP